MRGTSNKQAPLGLGQYEEQTVWMIGVQYGDPAPETVIYFATETDAVLIREEAIRAGGRPRLDSVLEITTSEATDAARRLGAIRVAVLTAEWETLEEWLV